MTAPEPRSYQFCEETQVMLARHGSDPTTLFNTLQQLKQQAAAQLAYWEQVEVECRGIQLAQRMLKATQDNLQQAVTLLRDERNQHSLGVTEAALAYLLPYG